MILTFEITQLFEGSGGRLALHEPVTQGTPDCGIPLCPGFGKSIALSL
jgi:hypothetical protein